MTTYSPLKRWGGEFCAEHDIAPDIQDIRIDELNAAYHKVEKGDVRYRFVIDMSSLHGTA